jgi:acyl carrier protein
MSSGDAMLHVRNTLVEMFKIDPATIKPEARLYEDLDLDSIDAIDLVAKLQGISDRRLEEDELREIHTVGDIVALVDRVQQGK